MDLPRPPRTILLLTGAAAFVIAIAGLRAAAGIVAPVALALVLTITVHPLRAPLSRRLPGWLVSLLMIVAVYVILIVMILALVVSIAQLASLVPTYATDVNQLWADVASGLRELGVAQAQVDAVASAFDVGKLASLAGEALTGVLGVLSDLFFLVTVLLFMAYDASPASRAVSIWERQRPRLVNALHRFAHGTRAYIAVSAGFGAIVAVIDTAALWLLGIPGAFVWGVLAFATNFIPNIGFVIGVIPPAVIGLLEGGPTLMFWVIVVYSGINVVVQTVIQPRVVGDAVGLSTTLTFLSLVFWAWTIGALGALLAVPLTLLLRALLVDADPDMDWLQPLITGKADQSPDDA